MNLISLMFFILYLFRHIECIMVIAGAWVQTPLSRGSSGLFHGMEEELTYRLRPLKSMRDGRDALAVIASFRVIKLRGAGDKV